MTNIVGALYAPQVLVSSGRFIGVAGVDEAPTRWSLNAPNSGLYCFRGFAPNRACASLVFVEVVLRKVGRKPGRAVVGRLLRAPRKGSVVVIEFPDGLHEYVTTPVKRILRVCGGDVYYLQTANSRYRLEVRSSDSALASEAPAAK